VPETFVIDKAGRIRYRHPGPLTPDIVDTEIRPLLTELSK
jgi:cytochrome c biogenesis protein CcmG/thiol:disulfide interchange protein DsbE